MFAFATPRRTRKPSLTPMIDVVFLLLVFFMLAARFGQDAALPLTVAGGGQEYSGPPRLIGVGAEGVTLNGQPVALDALAEALRPLMETPDDALVLRPGPDARLQDLTDVTDVLTGAGFSALVLVE